MVVRTNWTVEHLCGHEFVHHLSDRPTARRAGFARWLAGRDCTDCWKAAHRADTESKEQWLASKRAEEQQAAAEWARKFDMPPLEGPVSLPPHTRTRGPSPAQCAHSLPTTATSSGTCGTPTPTILNVSGIPGHSTERQPQCPRHIEATHG
ncbi:hypothetical protein [Streptomyces sp. NPDC127033]|uniref:hypothetical protein n=1 Tax=Streptomyces sp. NPDC127033 TaxID=3347110 RepID=UPI00364A86CD